MFARGGKRWRFEYCGTRPLPCYEHNTSRSHSNSRGNRFKWSSLKHHTKHLKTYNIHQKRVSGLQRQEVTSQRAGEHRGETRMWPSFIRPRNFNRTLLMRQQLKHIYFELLNDVSIETFITLLHALHLLNKLYFIQLWTLSEDGLNWHPVCLMTFLLEMVWFILDKIICQMHTCINVTHHNDPKLNLPWTSPQFYKWLVFLNLRVF